MPHPIIKMELLMAKPLQREFEYYLAKQPELVTRFRGRFIVIKGEEVLGDYGSEFEAIRETEKIHELGSFLVQQVDEDPESTTQIFHSRVVFA